MSHRARMSFFLIVVCLATAAHAHSANRVTILYDAFGKNPALTMDWGCAALVE